MFGIEVSRQVRQDCSTLHDTQTVIVVIDEHWNSAIGALLREPRLLLDEGQRLQIPSLSFVMIART